MTIEGLQSASQPTGLPPLPAVQTALQILLDASRRAAELQRPRWEFAVEIHELRAAGVPTSTLRWLVCQAYAQHAQETTGPRDVTRQFQPVNSLVFTDRSIFLLTKGGAALAVDNCNLDVSPVATESHPSPAARPVARRNESKPHWLTDRRELRYQGHLVKQFRVPAPNQEVVLAAFEEEGWPPHIDDPLPQPVEIDSRRRLHATVNSLNRNQRHPLLRFGTDSTASGIYWEPRGDAPGSPTIIPLAEALEQAELEPGRTYRCLVKGQVVEVRVLRSATQDLAVPFSEADVMLEPWTELPLPKAVCRVEAQRGYVLPFDVPELPRDGEDG